MTDHRALLFAAALPFAVLAAGCRGTSTSDVLDTDDIVATIDVNDDGSGTVTVTADLDVRTPGNDDRVRLVGDDALLATFGAESLQMGALQAGRYITSFDLSSAAELRISFERTKFESAPDTVGLLPDPMDIGGFEGLVISRSFDSIVLELPATSFDKTVELDGSCVSGLVFDVGTSAQDVIVNPGDLYASYSNAECDVTITLTSTAYGAVDPALHRDSTFVLSRSRSTTFYSVP